MAARLIIFENETERSMMSAEMCHKWQSQENIFGGETQKLLTTCYKLFHVAIRVEQGDQAKLLKKICGIAKAHGVYITWYGSCSASRQPDRFLISGRGEERLGFIQC